MKEKKRTFVIGNNEETRRLNARNKRPGQKRRDIPMSPEEERELESLKKEIYGNDFGYGEKD
ncbi:hypothetical protein [Porphyromonas levii]|uniref:hypothetical protein n=1 Tax=Porphyromonas levii TaxID=28114 RepID=UPI0003793610|nr:hypothetical protein [Porphyromonas levii]MBR8712266.1 hypothetical protein [Porphyromonas levii]MBR8714268.1 hypothetical protein [Porphyromonas levii]MBR8726809.1 hypothetical protein [Porphyromonas levii]MBR8735116.1 hypothetical protein [Porphyromonas levii]MBR8759025.1 hypothetical protein [Porphyromonas levii]